VCLVQKCVSNIYELLLSTEVFLHFYQDGTEMCLVQKCVSNAYELLLSTEVFLYFYQDLTFSLFKSKVLGTAVFYIRPESSN